MKFSHWVNALSWQYDKDRSVDAGAADGRSAAFRLGTTDGFTEDVGGIWGHCLGVALMLRLLFREMENRGVFGSMGLDLERVGGELWREDFRRLFLAFSLSEGGGASDLRTLAGRRALTSDFLGDLTLGSASCTRYEKNISTPPQKRQH